MHGEGHVSFDQLMAMYTNSSGDDVEALVRGCARCEENLRWVRWLLDTARADRSVAPPPATLRRAFAIFPAAAPAARTGPSIMRRLFGELIFDSFRTPALALTRGGMAARQVRYAVPELDLDIDLRLAREPLRQDHYSLTGQVLAAASASPAPTAVIVRAASGAEVACTLYDTGEFIAESVAGGEQTLLVRVGADEIALPVPGI